MAPQSSEPRPVVVLVSGAVAIVLIIATTCLTLAGKSVSDMLSVLAVAGAFVGSIGVSRIHSSVQESNRLSNGNLQAFRDNAIDGNAALRDALITIAQQVQHPPAVIVPVSVQPPPPDPAAP